MIVAHVIKINTQVKSRGRSVNKTARETGNRWAKEMESEGPRAEMNKREREAVLLEAGGFCWPDCASPSEKLRYPSGLPLCAWQRVYRGPFFFKIKPLLPLAQLQIKAHSEGDSSARRPPLGNRRMNTFVHGKSGAGRSRRRTERGGKQGRKGKEGKDELTHTHTPTHKLHMGSPRTYSTFVKSVL